MVKSDPLSSSPLLRITDLTVSIGSQPIITGFNLELFPGEAVVLIGESGSGKSTVAHAILNLPETPGCIKKGEIWFDGKPLHLKTERELQHLRGKKIGMVFQDPMSALNPTLKIGWQIAETLTFHQKLSWLQAKRKTIALLEQVEIAEPAAVFDMYPFQLSGGMLQRVMIAIALSCEPLLLIADEPTTALDATIQTEILALLKKIKLASRMSILLITHDLRIVRGICERVVILEGGKTVEAGSLKTLLQAPQHPYTTLLCKKN